MSAETVTPGDRLGLTLFVAVVAHALLLLGVGFTWDTAKPDHPPMIEVTLARTPTKTAPKDFDFLAQANQEGGGHSKKANRPAEKAALKPDVRKGKAEVSAAPREAPAPQPDKAPVVHTARSVQKTVKQPEPTPKPKPKPTLAELIDARQQVAEAQATVDDTENLDAKYPSKQRITARTRYHAAAEYMRSWVQKVERVGNLNYPEQARRRDLSGQLILEVTIRPNGSVRGVRVLEPSDYRVLDQAAIRVVKLAGPYAPVPADVLKGKDLLVITRTWQFVGGNSHLSAQ